MVKNKYKVVKHARVIEMRGNKPMLRLRPEHGQESFHSFSPMWSRALSKKPFWQCVILRFLFSFSFLFFLLWGRGSTSLQSRLFPLCLCLMESYFPIFFPSEYIMNVWGRITVFIFTTYSDGLEDNVSDLRIAPLWNIVEDKSDIFFYTLRTRASVFCFSCFRFCLLNHYLSGITQS